MSDWRQDPNSPECQELLKDMSKTISLDFDGTLHPYEEGWCGSAPTDVPPIDGVREALARLRNKGYRLVIFSCRADHPEGEIGIKKWLQKYDLDGYISDITDSKPKATAYVDDRSVAFRPRFWRDPATAWEEVLGEVERIAAYKGHGSAQ